ncbi:Tetratricopeptide repeat protein 37 [Chytridiales sp. JEL 0842]|nr:Tetratricopeptide repeat protein 37 [Chytridiales sp. JEL 0842]
MATLKQCLKSAREAINSKLYEEAKDHCLSALELDAQNYNALVFLALCHQNLGDISQSEATYKKATFISPTIALAFQGLLGLYDTKQDKTGQIECLKQLQNLYQTAKDAAKFEDTLQRLAAIYEGEKDLLKAIEVLMAFIDASSGDSALDWMPKLSKDRLVELWEKIVLMQEMYDADFSRTEVEKRRRRLGADSVAITRMKVEKELMQTSKLDTYYAALLKIVDTGCKKNAIKIKQLNLLRRKLSGVEPAQKCEIISALKSLASELCENASHDAEPYSILIQHTNLMLENFDVQFMTIVAERLTDSELGAYAKAFLQWKVDHDSSSALDTLKAAGEFNDSDHFAQHLLAVLLYELKDYDASIDHGQKAKAAAERFQEISGEDLSGFLASIDLYLAKAYYHLGPKLFQTCLNLYSNVLNYDTSNYNALIGQCVILAAMESYDAAFEKVEEILKLYPTNLEAKSEKAMLWVAQQRYQEALEVMLELDANFGPSYSLLGMYFTQVEDDRSRALRCLEKSIEIDSSDEEAVQALLKLYYEEQRLEDCILVLKKATTLKPKSGLMWRHLAFLHLEKGLNLDAIAAFQSSLRCDVKDHLAWQGLAEAYVKEGKYIAALRALERARDLMPHAFEHTFLSATVKHQLGLLSNALTDYNASIKAAADAGIVHLPSVLGLAKVYVSKAKESFENGSYGMLVVSLCDGIYTCLKGLKRYPDSISLLQVMGESSFLFRMLPKGFVFAEDITKRLHEEYQVFVDIDSHGKYDWMTTQSSDTLECVLSLASICFYRCLRLTQQDKSQAENAVPSLLHDLSLALFYRYENLKGQGNQNDALLNFALSSVSSALHSDPLNPSYWNTLAKFTLFIKPSICQHALIRSLELNPKAVATSLNLGFLYLQYGDFELAQSAFERAQIIDPEACETWIGMAFTNADRNINETYAHLQHAYETSMGAPVSINYLYAYCLCKFTSMDVDSFSCLFLTKLCQLEPLNAAAWNLRGLAFEARGIYSETVLSFKRSMEVFDESAEPGVISMVRENLARALCSEGIYDESCKVYSKLGESSDMTIQALIGYGYALFFNQQLDQSLGILQSAMEKLRTSDADSFSKEYVEVTVALAQILYTLESDDHIELAYQYLVESLSSASDQTIKAVQCACAFGILRQDFDFAATCVEKLMQLSRVSYDLSQTDAEWLISRYFIMTKGLKAGERYLSRAIHMYPWLTWTWNNLASLLTRFSPDMARSCSNLVNATTVLSSSSLSQLSVADRLDTYLVVGLSKMSLPTSTCSMPSQSSLQRAILTSPTNVSIWIALAIQLRKQVPSLLNSTKSGLAENSLPEVAVKKLDTLRNVLAQAEYLCQARLVDLQTRQLETELIKCRKLLAWCTLLSVDCIITKSYLNASSADVTNDLQDAIQMNERLITSNEWQGTGIEAVAYQLLGHALHCAGAYGDCVAALQKSVEANSGSADLWEDLAEVYTDQWQLKQAALCHLQSLSLSPPLSKLRTTPLLRLSRLSLLSGDYETAQQCIRNTLKIDSLSPGGRLMQALSLLSSNPNSAVKAKKILGALNVADVDPFWVDWVLSM